MSLACCYQDHAAVLQPLQALSKRKMQKLEKASVAVKRKLEGKDIAKGKPKVWHREHLKAYLNTSVLSELRVKTASEDLAEACSLH